MNARSFTLEELITKVDQDCFTAQDICGVVGADPQALRIIARERPDLLGFPAILIGNRVKFPRIPFLRFMGVQI